LDMTTVNAWILYRRHCDAEPTASKTMPLREFKAAVAEALCKSGIAAPSVKRGRPKDSPNEPVRKKRAPCHLPVDDVRFDGINHYPAMKTERKRCRRQQCTKITQVSCVKCDVHLCMSSKSNCFVAYHTL